jgi:hypothetical protein
LRIPTDAVIPEHKLTRYLLVPRPWDDKAKFLEQGGFSLSNWPDLLRALREFVAAHEAVEDSENEYGVFLRAEGVLVGPTGQELRIVTIWLRWHLDGSVHFVTLKPRR